MCAALLGVLSGLRAAHVAACKRRTAAEEHKRESEASADPRVLPVEPGGDDLRLADRPRLRPYELDLVARGVLRKPADDLDLIAAVDRVIHRHCARHAVG